MLLPGRSIRAISINGFCHCFSPNNELRIADHNDRQVNNHSSQLSDHVYRNTVIEWLNEDTVESRPSLVERYPLLAH